MTRDPSAPPFVPEDLLAHLEATFPGHLPLAEGLMKAPPSQVKAAAARALGRRDVLHYLAGLVLDQRARAQEGA